MQSYVVQVPAGDLGTVVIQHLRAFDVEATIGTIAIPFTLLHRRKVDEATFPVVASVRDRAVTLPLFPGMTDEQSDAVVAAECLDCVT